jgi:hypothetical protein
MRLIGSWAATRWQYHGRGEFAPMVDLVCDLGASVTLSITAGTFILTRSEPGRDPQSTGGAIAVDDATLTLRAADGREGEVFRYQVTDDTLTLSSEAAAWRFYGDDEQPADFVAVLVRL